MITTCWIGALRREPAMVSSLSPAAAVAMLESARTINDIRLRSFSFKLASSEWEAQATDQGNNRAQTLCKLNVANRSLAKGPRRTCLNQGKRETAAGYTLKRKW